ncbi:hypothetical protein H0A66_15470 [Alcaligenaceae bacterium]|nr:hypothetical protein [Alcaligenaceae bacterium]
MLAGMVYGGLASAQAQSGQLKGKIGPHTFDVPVQCEMAGKKETPTISAMTDSNRRKPLEDVNGDGVAGQVSSMNGTVVVSITFGDDFYRFNGKKNVEFRSKGFTWKETIKEYDNEKMKALMEAGKRLKDQAPERVYEIDLEFSCQ